jgi:hypothetical protein
MSKNDTNRQKVFADVISIDAWHDKFSDETDIVDLHADVVFGAARVGGETDSRVRFRLSIKRAELAVIIPDSEPFAVDKQSVARFGDVTTIAQSLEQTTEVHGSMEGTGSLAAGLTKVSAKVGAKLLANAKHTAKEKLKWTGKRASIIVTYRFHNVEKSDRWSFEPGAGPVLDGRPWDALKSPLLKLVDRRTNRRKGIAPSVRLELRCLREDLEIKNIEIKNANSWERLKSRLGNENRLKAAEAYIRNQLEQTGLEAGDLSDKFAKITLSDVIANNGRIG